MWEKVKGDVDVVSVTQQLKHLPAFGGNSIASLGGRAKKSRKKVGLVSFKVWLYFLLEVFDSNS